MKIGGVKEKTMAAQRAGAKVLIFPAGNWTISARRAALRQCA
jgi:ATP-dependent Lon protease